MMLNYKVFWDGMSEEKVSRRVYAIYYYVPIPKESYMDILKSIIKKFNTSKNDIIHSLNEVFGRASQFIQINSIQVSIY